MAAIVYGVARSHPFVDGNKRPAFALCIGALALNGLRFDPPGDIVEIMVDPAKGSLDEARFEAVLRNTVSPDPEIARLAEFDVTAEDVVSEMPRP